MTEVGEPRWEHGRGAKEQKSKAEASNTEFEHVEASTLLEKGNRLALGVGSC